MKTDSRNFGPRNRWTNATVLAAALAMALSAIGFPSVANAAAPMVAIAPTVPPHYVRTTQGPALAQMYPVDVAATATDYYSIDPGKYNLVRVRRSDGQIVKTAGGHQGKGDQQFAAARALALDSAGNVFVADTPNNRVSKWTANLGFVKNFGSSGSGAGQFQQIYGVAVGTGLGVGGASQEIVYTVDGGGSNGTGGGSGRIQKFTLDGTPLGAFASGFTFNQPRQLAVHPDTNDVYIVDARNHRVTVFDQQGTFKFAFGKLGSGDGQFKGDPRGITLSSSGDRVFVSDSNNNRIQVFNSATGAYLWKIDSSVYNFVGPRGLATTPDGKLVVADEWGYGLVEFNLGSSSATLSRKLFGGAPSVNGVNSPRGMAINSSGQLYVVDWWNQRIVRSNLDGSGDFAWGSRGPSNSPGSLNFPWDVAIQPVTNRVFVANRESNQIAVFSADGTFISNQSTRGAGNGQLQFPQGVAFDPTDGSLLVSDSGNARVQRFKVNAGGSLTWLATYGGPTAGSAVGKFNVPAGIDVAPDGTIWVADTGNNRVQKRTPNGTWTAFSQPGGTTTTYALSRPWGVTVAPDGSIWIADTAKDRIVKISSDGQTRFFAANAAAMGIPAGSDGVPGIDPFAIEFGPSGQVFVSDIWHNRVVELGLS